MAEPEKSCFVFLQTFLKLFIYTQLERAGKNNQTALFWIHTVPSLSGILNASGALYDVFFSPCLAPSLPIHPHLAPHLPVTPAFQFPQVSGFPSQGITASSHKSRNVSLPPSLPPPLPTQWKPTPSSDLRSNITWSKKLPLRPHSRSSCFVVSSQGTMFLSLRAFFSVSLVWFSDECP